VLHKGNGEGCRLRCERGGEVLMDELVVEWIMCSRHREGDLHMLSVIGVCLEYERT
jgi:hypothetical protein